MSRRTKLSLSLTSLIALVGTGFTHSAPVQAMGPGNCPSLSGTYVLETCSAGRPLRLMGDSHVVNGFVYKRDWLPIGGLITLSQSSCESLTLDYRGLQAVHQVTLNRGKTLVSGKKGMSSSRTTRTVRRLRNGFRVRDDERYVYVPVISVFHTYTNWRFERENDGSITVSYQRENKEDGNICRLSPRD